MALSSAKAWRTPLGDVPVSRDLSSRIAAECPSLALDDRAHEREHSIEVQLPFLACCHPDAVSIVPIVLGDVDQADVTSLGSVLGELVSTGEATLLATTDLSHYLPLSSAQRADDATIAGILSGDTARLESDYRVGRARLCGWAPVAVAMVAAAHAGLTEATLLARCTSADTGGPTDAVVGYAAICFRKPASTETASAS
jgi:hypothetical protein